MKPPAIAKWLRSSISRWLLLFALLLALSPQAQAEHPPQWLQASPDSPGFASLMDKIQELHPEVDWHQYREFQNALWNEFPEFSPLSGNLPRALGYAMPQPPEGKAGNCWHDPTVWIDRWSGLPKNLGNLMEYILFQAWLEENYPGRIWFDNTQWHWKPGSTRARDTLRDLLAQPQGTPALDVLAQLEATGWMMEYDHFCGWQTDGQLHQRAPLPEEELEDDLRMLPGVGQLMAARDAYQGIQRLSDCGLKDTEGWQQLGGGVAGLAMSGTGTKLTGIRGIRSGGKTTKTTPKISFNSPTPRGPPATKNVGRTETVQRWMSRTELEATKKTGLLRGGRKGAHHVTDAANASARRARRRLSLRETPEVRVTMEVPGGIFSSPTRVKPLHGMPGGGMERTAIGQIPVRILWVDGKP
jgi:hypothetical protein